MPLLILSNTVYYRKIDSLFTFHYASTYTAHWYPCASYLSWFTFHYASTYTVLPVHIFMYPYFYLHSTMPLLIQLFGTQSKQLSQIYIPLCLYLYGGLHCNRRKERWFTFHYASTYTYKNPSLFTRDIFIFHYASTYTQMKICAFLLLTLFTFHYASTYTWQNQFRSRLNKIYIPLCLYLYPSQSPSQATEKRFTFHYASTYTLSAAVYGFLIFWFTFHYASTYTAKWLYGYVKTLDLHSTMPLLIPNTTGTIFQVCYPIFTFHYASTYTCGSWCNRAWIRHIYIPLCLYLYKHCYLCHY